MRDGPQGTLFCAGKVIARPRAMGASIFQHLALSIFCSSS